VSADEPSSPNTDTSDGDCLVVGGGPAGATCARLLAERGLRVTLVDDGRVHRSGPYESLLPAAVRRLLGDDRRGADATPLRHGSIWGSDELVFRDEPEPGLAVQRAAFDAALRARAAAAGVTVRRATWSGVGDTAARCVVLATGRRSFGQQPVPCAAAGPETTALTFVGEPAEQDRGTAVVEAVAGGWLWMHAPVVGPAAVVAFVDGGAGAAARAEVALEQALGPARRLRHGVLQHASDATARLFVGQAPRLTLRIGDAASRIDPLASQGIEKAAASAEHAAVLVEAGLREPGLSPQLVRVHELWEAGLWRAHRVAAHAHLRRETRFVDEPFWQRRANDVLPEPPERLVVAQGVAVGEALAVHAGALQRAPGVVHARTGHGRVRHGRIAVRRLLPLFERPTGLADAVRAASQVPELFVVTPHEVERAIVELWREGFLAAVVSATATPRADP
jgi:hypothetical protein